MSSLPTSSALEARPLVEVLERKARESARFAIDRVARLLASAAVSLNRFAETLGVPAQATSSGEQRDGVIAEPPAA